MTAKYTPGPWDWGPMNAQAGGLQRVFTRHFGGTSSTVAVVGNLDDRRKDWREEERANARLIVAAPELYEACCRLLGEHLTEKDIAFARAACAKAVRS